MLITVRTIYDQHYCFDVDISLSVEEFKNIVFEQTGVHPLFQMLFWGSLILTDDMQLTDFTAIVKYFLN